MSHDTFEPVLRRTIRHALLAAALASAGCASKKPAPSEPGAAPGEGPAKEAPTALEPASGWQAIACDVINEGQAGWIKTGTAYDFVSVRTVHTPEGRPTVASEAGEACAGASEAAACASSLETIHAPFLRTECGQICIEKSVVTTRGDEVRRWVPDAALSQLAKEPGVAEAAVSPLSELVAPIASGEEAWVYANLSSLLVGRCGEAQHGGWRAVEQGFELRGLRMTNPCPITYDEVVLLVKPDGSTEVVAQKAAPDAPGTGACIGRRPEGLAPGGSMVRLADYLSGCARLEAASVFAFERMKDELERFDAPGPLIEAAERARVDEVRHAAQVAFLAGRHGGSFEQPERPTWGERSLEAFALENAVEGCVRETFGALLGCWQAEHAGDEVVRHLMAGISDDEVRHASLAWNVHRWVMGRLDAAARARVRSAMDAAFDELEAGAEVGEPSDKIAVLGLPDVAASRVLVATLRERLAA